MTARFNILLLVFAALVFSSLRGVAADIDASPGASPGSSATVKLVEVDAAQKRGAGEISGSSNSVAAGQQFVAASKDGQDCRVEISSVKGNVVQIDISNCKSPDQLTIGQTLRPSLIEPGDGGASAKSSPAPSPKLSWADELKARDGTAKFFGKVFYSTGSSLKSSTVTATGLANTYTGTMEVDSTGAPGIGIEVFRVPQHYWGFDIGFEYEFSRNLTNETVTLNGTTANATLQNTKITVGDLYANAVYRWSEFYFPVGFNWSYINESPAGGDNLMGMLGVQIGIGWYYQHFGVELLDRVLQFTGSFNTGTVAGNYGLLQMPGLQLSLKYGWDM